jgi:hypothetical protein
MVDKGFGKYQLLDTIYCKENGVGATRGLEVERRTRNWAIRVQFPPGAI